jgi:DNA-binding transcriptional regulator YhcF (GntR family)
MEIEHLTIFMLNRNALSDVALRVLLYIQIAHKFGGNAEKRIVYISRRRICKRLSISIGACRSAVKQLVDFGYIQLTDSKGSPVADSSNWIVLNPKEKLNHEKIKSVIDLINKVETADGGSLDDPGSAGLFDNIMEE